MEVVKKEIHELLNNGLIYPIGSSNWVSPIHVVPKKSRITIKDNIAIRIAIGWRMCIDYRKLNEATKKNHFPLPFI